MQHIRDFLVIVGYTSLLFTLHLHLHYRWHQHAWSSV